MIVENDSLESTMQSIEIISRLARLHGVPIWEFCVKSEPEKVPVLRLKELVLQECQRLKIGIEELGPRIEWQVESLVLQNYSRFAEGSSVDACRDLAHYSNLNWVGLLAGISESLSNH